jgi:hypothetical protein
MTGGAPLPADPGRQVPRLGPAVERLPAPDGGLRLRGPLLARRGPHRWLAWLFAAPPRIEVELDDIGAFVVARMDGRSLGQLADDLAAQLKLTRREAEVALAQFIAGLARRRLVTLAPAEAGA